MTVNPSPDNPLYRIGDVAKIFGVEDSTVRRWIRNGDIKAFKLKNRWRIEREEVIRLANEVHG